MNISLRQMEKDYGAWADAHLAKAERWGRIEWTNEIYEWWGQRGQRHGLAIWHRRRGLVHEQHRDLFRTHEVTVDLSWWAQKRLIGMMLALESEWNLIRESSWAGDIYRDFEKLLFVTAPNKVFLFRHPTRGESFDSIVATIREDIRRWRPRASDSKFLVIGHEVQQTNGPAKVTGVRTAIVNGDGRS